MKFWFKCDLIERDHPNRQFDLGKFHCDTRETAEKHCRAKYKNLVGKFQTGHFTIETYATSAPDSLPTNTRTPRPAKAIADLYPKEEKA